jgi:hypothetical protein
MLIYQGYYYRNKGTLSSFSSLKEMGLNHDMRPLLLLLNDNFTVLKAVLNDK